MAQFDFSPEDFKDSAILLNKTLAQSQKDLPQGVFASTTQSKEEGGGFDNTVLGVGDLLQKIPYTRNIGNSADDTYSTLLSAASGTADVFDGVDKFYLGLIPDDVKRVIDVVNAAKGTDSFAFSPEDKAAAEALVAHPNFKVADGVKAESIKGQITSGVVSPNIIKFLKLIADQQTDIFIHKLHGGADHNLLQEYHNLSGPQDRKYTKAVDFGFTKDKKEYTEPEAAKIKGIADSITDGKRPREFASAFKFQKTDRETDKHNTLWVKNDKYKKYIHVAIDDWGIPPPPPPPPPAGAGAAPGDPGAAAGGGSPGLPAGAVSKPGMQLWLAERCRQAGLDVVEVAGWQTRGSSSFTPAGVVCHHTAGPAAGADLNQGILINGRPDLAGPLCNIGLGRSGRVYIIAAGRANHAGSGGWKGLSGNGSVLGIEAENNGSQAWPAAQLLAYYKLCAALISGVGRGPDMVCGHKEWTTRKPDPHSIDMNQFRGEVAKYMPGAPGAALPVAPGAGTPVAVPSGNVQQLCQQILAIPSIIYDPNPKGTMQGFAGGATQMRAGNGNMTGLSVQMLSVLLEMGRSNLGTIRVSSIITGSHTTNSLHYSGRGCDIGNEENLAPFRWLYANRVRLNLYELFFDAPPAGTSSWKNGSNVGPIGGHLNHYHFGTKS